MAAHSDVMATNPNLCPQPGGATPPSRGIGRSPRPASAHFALTARICRPTPGPKQNNDDPALNAGGIRLRSPRRHSHPLLCLFERNPPSVPPGGIQTPVSRGQWIGRVLGHVGRRGQREDRMPLAARQTEAGGSLHATWDCTRPGDSCAVLGLMSLDPSLASPGSSPYPTP